MLAGNSLTILVLEFLPILHLYFTFQTTDFAFLSHFGLESYNTSKTLLSRLVLMCGTKTKVVTVSLYLTNRRIISKQRDLQTLKIGRKKSNPYQLSLGIRINIGGVCLNASSATFSQSRSASVHCLIHRWKWDLLHTFLLMCPWCWLEFNSQEINLDILYTTKESSMKTECKTKCSELLDAEEVFMSCKCDELSRLLCRLNIF